MGKHEDSSYSVFDSEDGAGVAPLTVYINGQAKIIGKAFTVKNDDGSITTNMVFDKDAPPDIVAAFTGQGQSFSISEDTPVVNQRPDNIKEHIHRPVQHRDGKPPWCHTCGLTVGYLKPESRISRRD